MSLQSENKRLRNQNRRLKSDLELADETIKELQDSISIAIAGIQAIRDENKKEIGRDKGGSDGMV